MSSRTFLIANLFFVCSGMGVAWFISDLPVLMYFTHNFVHFLGFWCAFFTAWSIALVWKKAQYFYKKSPKYREMDMKFSHSALLYFLGILVVADFNLFIFLFAQ